MRDHPLEAGTVHGLNQREASSQVDLVLFHQNESDTDPISPPGGESFNLDRALTTGNLLPP
jgi:hypothetical protein